MTATAPTARARRFTAPAAGAEAETRFYVEEFARRRFRGHAHLDTDFRRFAATYRIAPAERRRVRRALEELLGCG